MIKERIADYLIARGISPSITILERFWKYVEKTGTCWLWTGATNGWTGALYVGRKSEIVACILAPRLSWLVHRGPIPDGLEVLHDCPGEDNPLCVNPTHLWLGTQAQNIRDLLRKDRRADDWQQGEKNSRAKLTVEQVRQIRRMLPPGQRAAPGNIPIMAAQFGVAPSTFQQARYGQHWKNV